MTPFAQTTRARVVLPLRFLAGVLAVLLAALAHFYVLMRPPFDDLRAMAAFLALTATLSLIAGYAAYRSGWTLLGIHALSTALTFINVWVAARLMFASQHDLLLATVLLFFASGIALVLGDFLSAGLRDRMRALSRAAQEVAAGRLDVQAPVAGRDEIAGLGRTLNAISAQLTDAAVDAGEKQRALESLHRDLIAWAGHDLRTPLASVRALLEALADGVVDEATERQRHLRTAQRELQLLSGAIDDLFELAQLDAGGLQLELRTASIGDLVSDTLESFSASAQTLGVTLRGSAEPGADPVVMDSSKIGRVLANLLTHALRHTPKGGTVEVRVWPERGEALVSVRDSGPGIDPEDLPHVFERFHRGERARNRASGGSGLGLAIAEGLIRAHEGRIWAATTPGAGATFTFALPLGAPSASQNSK